MRLRLVQGFSLLEALVAMALVATIGMALLAWINTNLLTLQRIEDKQRELAVTRTAIAFLEGVNFFSMPIGVTDLGPYRIEWTATPSEPVRDARSLLGGGMTPYQIGLFEAQVRVTEGNNLRAQFSFRQIGYAQVRNPLDGVF